MSPEKILEIDNLTYYYRSHWTGKRIDGVKNVSFSLDQGESFGFLGHNGAGKTTTIKCILNLLKPRSGNIYIFGRDHTDISQRMLLGYLPEQPYFYDHLTVKEILEMYAYLSGVRGGRSTVRESIERALELVKLEGRESSPMRSLSKGLTQRVAMAQAIIAKPKLLILDEPFSGLDPIGRKELRDLMIGLKSQGTTILLCSHILNDIEFFCDRVGIMVKGELKGVFDMRGIAKATSGSFEVLLRDAKAFTATLQPVPEKLDSRSDASGVLTKLSYSKRDSAEQALQSALENGITVESYNFVHGSLEDLFINLVSQSSA